MQAAAVFIIASRSAYSTMSVMEHRYANSRVVCSYASKLDVNVTLRNGVEGATKGMMHIQKEHRSNDQNSRKGQFEKYVDECILIKIALLSGEIINSNRHASFAYYKHFPYAIGHEKNRHLISKPCYALKVVVGIRPSEILSCFPVVCKTDCAHQHTTYVPTCLHQHIIMYGEQNTCDCGLPDYTYQKATVSHTERQILNSMNLNSYNK